MKKESWFLKIALIILSLIVLVIMGVFVRFIYVVFTDWREFTTAWAYLAMGLQIEALWAAFLYAVTQAWLILTRIERQEVFSAVTIRPLIRIKYASLFVCAVFLIGSPFFYFVAQAEDAPGLVLMGMLVAFASAAMTVFVAVLQKLLKQAIVLKSENDLTV
ncbi:putative membrane protein [Secundilactobacillus oryzae JCM 18671]|uniref:Putative membrane protein n=1 Tax=Secundilactobacillus oryzae JCM 18671 TaxID=1291743 RepID=A0A081BJE7_9LACO|nr:DUF2975 domain-containing protein [Secundilactobacillus oryzae]GAK48165.1 putative membrane protein [Secundilactobacillus oryzae JCM 18671]